MQYRGLELLWNEGEYYFEKDYGEPPSRFERKSMMDKFMQKYNLKCSYASTILSLNRLLTGRATVGERLGRDTLYNWYHNIFDHEYLFFSSKLGIYILTTQPYNLSLSRFVEFEEYCAGRLLQVYIDYDDAWHYPGSCPLIAIASSLDWRDLSQWT